MGNFPWKPNLKKNLDRWKHTALPFKDGSPENVSPWWRWRFEFFWKKCVQVTGVFCQSAIESAQQDHATVVQSMLENKEAWEHAGKKTGRNELNSWTDRYFVTFFPVRADVACSQRTRHECVTQNDLNAVFNTNSVANRHRFLHEMWSVARPIWAKCVPSLAKSKHLRAVMATASHLQCWKRKWTNQRCGNTWKLWVSWRSIIFSSCISCNIFFKYLGFKYLWKMSPSTVLRRSQFRMAKHKTDVPAYPTSCGESGPQGLFSLSCPGTTPQNPGT